MRILGLIAAASTVLGGCGENRDAPAPAPANGTQGPGAKGEAAAPAAAPSDPASRWDMESSGEGIALALLPTSGPATVRLFCPAGRKRLLVNVPSFRPVGSEERLSFGSGGEVVALVADTRGDRQRGGVSGTGDVPAGLAALVRVRSRRATARRAAVLIRPRRRRLPKRS